MRFEIESSVIPFWVCDIRGFEGEGGTGDDGASGEGGTNDDGSTGNEDDPDKGSTEDVTGLKSALQKERESAKTLAREKASLEKRLKAIEDKDKSDADKAKGEAETASTKVTKLAARLRETSIEQAIVAAASAKDAPKFTDIDDALRLIDRSDFGVEQDEDDPSDITVDSASVKKALADLAKKKPHLLVGTGGGQDPSGGKFGGGSKDKSALTEEALRKKYSALQ